MAIEIGRIPTRIYEDKARDAIIPYSDNETPSYIPNLFLGNGEEELADEYVGLPVERILRPDEVTGDSTRLLEIARELKEDIKNHFETRLQLFHLQLLIAHGTQLVFGKFKTKAQVGVKSKGKGDPESPTKKFPSKYQEAHASTLPNLQYITSEEYDNTDLSTLKPKILALGTSTYKVFNTTHKLSGFVNSVDLEIDKNIKPRFFDSFRHFCIKLLNDISQSNKATFMGTYRNFLFNIDKVLDMGLPLASRAYEREVFTYYKEVAGSYLSKVDDPRFWRALAFCQTFEEDQLGTICQSIRSRISLESACDLRIERIRNRSIEMFPDIKFREEILKVSVIRLSSADTKTREIEDLIDRTYPYAPDGVNKHVKACLENAEIIAEAKKILNSFAQFKGILSNADKLKKSAFSESIKSKRGAVKHVQNIAIRVLFEVSTATQQANPVAVRLCRFFMISPSSVVDLLEAQSIQFKEKSDLLSRDLLVKAAFEELKVLLAPPGPK